jgi:hypothetical protein
MEDRMTTRQRPWFRFDSGFPDQDTIRDLGAAYGAAGQLVMVVLFCDAAAAYSQKAKDFDVVDGRYSGLARRVHTDTETVQAILRRAVDVGLIESLATDDPRRYSVRLLQHAKWNAKDPNGAARQRRTRERGREGL